MIAVYVLAVIGGIFALYVAVSAWKEIVWPWLLLHVFRKAPIAPWRVTRLTYAMKLLKAQGWEIKIYGFSCGARFGFGFITGKPPIFVCETCHHEFKSEALVIEHEKKEKHGDYRD